jgi:hypothetical protein
MHSKAMKPALEWKGGSPSIRGPGSIASQSNRAAVTQTGDLYLAGYLKTFQPGPLQPDGGGAAFEIVRGSDHKVVSLIDLQGNLKLLDDNADPGDPEDPDYTPNPHNPRNGYLLEYGIPHDFLDCAGVHHHYSDYTADDYIIDLVGL